MGGAVKAITSPANIVGSVLGKVPVVGPVLGPAANIAMGGNPFTAIAGGVVDAATGGFGGGGGGGGGSSTPTYIQPGYNYGANTYTVGGNPYDASKYFITGDKGVYNLMPELGNLYGHQATNKLPGATSYNVYNSIYNKMADDAAAQAAFAKAYGPQTFTPVPTMGNKARRFGLQNFEGPGYLKNDIRDAYREQLDAYRTANPRIPGATRPAFTPTPIQYSNFGFGKNATVAENPFNALADYAAKQKNPFFVPFAPATPTPPVTPTTPTGGTGTTTPTAEAGGQFRPVNIRTGGLASLRRK